jgi:5'(3')-deoxyribonucleotidase
MVFVLGVDLDGVCADFYSRMREVVAELKGVKPEKLTKNVSYGLKEWKLEDRYEDIHRFAVTQRKLFKTVKPIKGAVPALRRLSADEVHIRIITHRLFIPHFHRAAVSQTTWWLDHHGFPYRDICFLEEKAVVDADLYIEDTPKNICQLLERERAVIVFSNSTNLDMEANLRANNWLEVEEIVRSQLHTDC